MISDEIKELSRNVDDLVRLLRPKKITAIKSKEDLNSLHHIILKWGAISRCIKLEGDVKKTLDDEIAKCVKETSLENPMRIKIVRILNDFNTILKREVILNLSVSSQTILHADIREAMKKFEGSLKDSLEKEYFEEAEKCLENGLNRAFIVCSWSVVMYRLYQLIRNRGFCQFVSAFALAYPNTKITLNALSDFYDISDSKTIGIAASKSITPYIIDKQQKEILERNLKIRNMSAHVSQNFRPTESTVLVYIDEVVDTFLSKT